MAAGRPFLHVRDGDLADAELIGKLHLRQPQAVPLDREQDTNLMRGARGPSAMVATLTAGGAARCGSPVTVDQAAAASTSRTGLGFSSRSPSFHWMYFDVASRV